MPVETPAVRKVAQYLILQGKRLPTLSASARKSAERKADSFECTLSITATEKVAGFDEAFWANLEDADAAVEFEVDSRSKKLVSGKLDVGSIDWLNRTVSVSGRDKSAKLSEKRSNKKHANKKSSEIVKEIAQAHGLNPVIEETDDDAGKKYDQDSAHLALNTTDFETLSLLAEREGYRWYVEGDDLHFEPKPEGKQGAYVVRYRKPTREQYEAGNFIHLRTKRNHTAARKTKVKVKSWHHKDKKLYEHTAEADGSGETVEHEHHIPGLNQQQTEKIAKSRLKNAIRHDLSAEIDMPGDLDIEVTQGLQLEGTKTIFDQTYDIDSIHFDGSWDSHFRMSISTKAPKKGRKTK